MVQQIGGTIFSLAALGIGIFIFFKVFNGGEILKNAFESLKAFGAESTDTVQVVEGGQTTTTEVVKETTLIQTETVAIPTFSVDQTSESLSQIGARLDEQNKLFKQQQELISQQSAFLTEQQKALAATLQVESSNQVVVAPLQDPTPTAILEPEPIAPTGVIVANISGIGDVTLEQAQAFLSAQGFESLLESLDPAILEESTLTAAKEFQETIALAVGVSEFGSGFRTGFANPCFDDPFSCGCDFCMNNPSSPRCAACN